jgi:hypothetical protein
LSTQFQQTSISMLLLKGNRYDYFLTTSIQVTTWAFMSVG